MPMLYFNQQPLCMQPSQSLADLLKQHYAHAHYFAVEINGTLIPRSQYHATQLNEADVISILVPMAGG